MHGRAKQIDIIDKWKRGENNDATKLKTNMDPKEKRKPLQRVCVCGLGCSSTHRGWDGKQIFRMAMKTLGGYIYEKTICFATMEGCNWGIQLIEMFPLTLPSLS